jgi:hypothetical protein
MAIGLTPALPRHPSPLRWRGELLYNGLPIRRSTVGVWGIRPDYLASCAAHNVLGS